MCIRDRSTPALSTPAFLTVPRCPLPRFQSSPSRAADIIRASYYICGPWCDEINFCCFICVTQWWALHVVIKRQFFLHFIVNRDKDQQTEPGKPGYDTLSGTGVHCDHTVHVSADLSLWLNSTMFWAPASWHQSMSTSSQPSLSSSTWNRGMIG